MPDRQDVVLARRFHEAYERLAPEFGYKTREASAVPWEDVPEANRLLMQAVAEEILEEFVPLSRAERAEAEVERLIDAALKVLRHFVDRHHGGGFKPLGDGESVDRDVAALQRSLSPDREDSDG